MADENTGAQGTESQTPNIQDVLNSPEAKAMFQEMVDQEVSGLKNKNSELLEKLKTTTEALKGWDGFDQEQVKNLMDRIQNDEETRLLAEGKVDEVVSRRTELLKKDYEHQIQSLTSMIEEKDNVLHTKDEKLKELVIDGQIREAYTRGQYEPQALDDVIRLGRTVYAMDENGKAVPRDSEGNLKFGKDGKSQMTPDEWLEELAETKKYLRPASSGGGSHHSGKGSSGFDASTASPTQKIAEGLRKRGM